MSLLFLVSSTTCPTHVSNALYLYRVDNGHTSIAMKRVASQLRTERDEEDKVMLAKAGATSDSTSDELPAETVIKVPPLSLSSSSLICSLFVNTDSLSCTVSVYM